ncbi:histidine kinase [Leucobacter sp. NPDC077196]|uniref:sensor histidine kinase n=1 Tax=Leucobacter sp. NPDC077196 TaxID=3154959 RepID=UPI003441DA71
MKSADTHRAPGAGVTATWNYTLGSIVFLFIIIDAIIAFDYLADFTATRDPLVLALLISGLLAAAARIRYCWFLRDDDFGPVPPRAWTIALFAPAVLSWALAFAVPELSVYAAAQIWFSGVLFAAALPGSRRWIVTGIMLGATAIPALWHVLWDRPIIAQPVGLSHGLVLLYGAMLPFMLFTSLWMWRIIRRLDEARVLAAKLAVTQERLRFAADLHDIQGHHLQVIALQAELAERTLGADTARTAAQLTEIRLTAKHAMEETRSLVAGLRDIDFADELENAREVLSLSGAACALEITDIPRDPAAQRVLGFAVREATTNILRHSTATRATIELASDRDGYALTITNNGVGDAVDPADSHGGSGLAGLRDRVAAIGGTLAVDRSVAEGAECFELSVWIPGDDRRGGAQ